jgi:hypothetical protein
MTDEEYAQHHEQKWAELSADFKVGAIKVLADELPDDIKQEIRYLHAKHGAHWIHEIPMGHFGFGMNVRNLLRSKGFTDAKAGGNLDDFYCQLLEAAVGARQ